MSNILSFRRFREGVSERTPKVFSSPSGIQTWASKPGGAQSLPSTTQLPPPRPLQTEGPAVESDEELQHPLWNGQMASEDQPDITQQLNAAVARRASIGTMMRVELDNEVEDVIDLLGDGGKNRRASVAIRGTRQLADISTTAEGRTSLLQHEAIPQLVGELAHYEAKLRHAAEDVLANLAEDAEAQPARLIAEEIVSRLFNLQSEETGFEAGGRESWDPSPGSLEAQGQILSACVNLTVLSRNMCLNFESNGVIRCSLPYISSGFGLARQKALALLANLCKHSRISNHTLQALGGDSMLLRLLPVLILSELLCCSKRLPIIRQERMHVVSIIRSVYGLPEAQKSQEVKQQAKGGSHTSWQDTLNSSEQVVEARASNIARSFLHKSRNIAGANRRTERERTTRARLTEVRARETQASADEGNV